MQTTKKTDKTKLGMKLSSMGVDIRSDASIDISGQQGSTKFVTVYGGSEMHMIVACGEHNGKRFQIGIEHGEPFIWNSEECRNMKWSEVEAYFNTPKGV